MLKNVVFLDRDGVINRDSPNYVKSWDEFHFLPGSLEAIARLTASQRTVFLITNQSAVHRRIISKETLYDIHHKLRERVLAHHGKIEDIFYCPHRPDENCSCRKPKPGLILQAQKKYDIDLSTAFMVGDNPKDIECAKNAGCRVSILVRTGLREDGEAQLATRNIFPDYIARDLAEAADWIIDGYKDMDTSP
jgi:histidinol-phosphate phosphatase family protein